MTLEEEYIKILNSKRPFRISIEASRNYETASLYLKKFGASINLGLESYREINRDAFKLWLNSTHAINLFYNVPEITAMLPEEIGVHLLCSGSAIEEIPHVIKINGNVNLTHSKIKSMRNLEVINGSLFVEKSSISNLSNLKEISGNFTFKDNCLEELPSLEKAGEIWIYESCNLPALKEVETLCLYFKKDLNPPNLNLPNLNNVKIEIRTRTFHEEYWKNYFINTGRAHLAEKIRAIQ